MAKKSNIENLIASFQEQQTKFREMMQKEFKKTFSEFFKEVPECTAVIWTQYSPYFNDGEECVFRVYSSTFTNCPVDQLEYIGCGEYVGEEENIWTYGDDSYGDGPQHNIRPAMDALDRLIHCREMSGILQAMFGNHVEVTATAEGFDIDDYDHD
jgi:hypothetical protein